MMKILIMCGGRGKRLGATTKSVPKPLVPFNGRTILEIKIERYIQQGYNEFVFCIGYKGNLIREAVTSNYPNLQAHFPDAGEKAGILNRLYHAKDLFDSHVLMTYGDTFSDLETKELHNTHINTDNEATIVITKIQNPFGLVEYDKNDKVTVFREKPVLNYYMGNAIINKSSLDLVNEKILTMENGKGLVNYLKILSAMQKLGIYYHSGSEITFNTQEELKLAEKQLIRFYTTPIQEAKNEE